jgi:hypothetical protein
MNWPRIINFPCLEKTSGIVSSLNFMAPTAPLLAIFFDARTLEHIGDHARLAGQIIPGIGFISSTRLAGAPSLGPVELE